MTNQASVDDTCVQLLKERSSLEAQVLRVGEEESGTDNVETTLAVIVSLQVQVSVILKICGKVCKSKHKSFNESSIAQLQTHLSIWRRR
eukprot:1172811-Amphidinium_carterae.1